MAYEHKHGGSLLIARAREPWAGRLAPWSRQALSLAFRVGVLMAGQPALLQTNAVLVCSSMETMPRAAKARDDGKLSDAPGRQPVAPEATSGRE